jgi:glutamate N-acetyltransferase / amino-acid N-acetyltransferase
VSVTVPQGFRAAGVTAGLKPSGRPDVALVVNDGPAHAAAGLFTRNKVQAAPVLWSRQVLATGRLRAVVLNSGGANACTGPQGFQTAHATAEKAAELLGCGPIEVAVCSTGIIGEQLPRDVLLAGVEAAAKALGDDPASGRAAATAIMTTDTVVKEATHSDAAGWSIGGTTKGAGMIAPSMATMLTVLTTDAVVDAPVLDHALRAAVRVSFDRLDVDGSMSTNDTVLVLASGASGVPADPAGFTAALTGVCRDLASQMQADAEGVTKRVTVRVTGAATEDEAVVVARTVARDSLVKTAMFGSDPNWGRIAAAAGYADAALDPERLEVMINGVLLCRGGVAAGERTAADLSGPEVLVEVGLGLGDGAAEILTTDLSHGYVEENSAYST